jgi:hypothetical protein
VRVSDTAAMIRKDKQDMCTLRKHINHQQKATTVMKVGELKNLLVIKIIVGTWSKLTKGTE